MEAFFRRVARKISDGVTDLNDMRSVLEFFARGYPPAWLLLSELEQEAGGPSNTKRAAECIRRYLESHPTPSESRGAWQRLYHFYRAEDDVIGGCDAFLRAAEIAHPPLDEISTMANWLNTAPELKSEMDIIERRTLFKPLASLMQPYLADASATDLSRLAWLYLHSGDADRALEVAALGVKREPENIHCQRLVAKLTTSSY